MEQAREQEVKRITAQFVAEQEAGQKPRLEDYARRYPQYVDEITDFVTYYYAVEVSLPTDTASVPSLSAGSRAALNLAWERVNTPLPAEAVTLTLLAQRQRCSFTRLAAVLDVGVDVVEQLAGHRLDPASIPHEVLLRLVTVLGQSMSVVRQALGLFEVPSTPKMVMERKTPYVLPNPQKPPTFRDALLASSQISPAQKNRWLALLEREGL